MKTVSSQRPNLHRSPVCHPRTIGSGISVPNHVTIIVNDQPWEASCGYLGPAPPDFAAVWGVRFKGPGAVVYMVGINMGYCIHVGCSSGSNDDRHERAWFLGLESISGREDNLQEPSE